MIGIIKNKRGQSLGLGVITAIMIFIIGMTCINFLKTDITSARSSSGLDCSNTTGISDGTKITCLVVDLTIPYFILLVCSIAGGLIVSRFIS